MNDEIIVNGVPVVMSVELRTGPGEGWIGSRFVGGPFQNMRELNDCINKHIQDIPVGWEIFVDFQDKV